MKKFLLIASACLLALLATTGASLPYPILPPLFASDAPNSLNHFLGLPPKLLLAIALLINPLGLLIGSAVLGPLSDRFGRRPVVLVTSIGAALGHVLTAGALVIQSYPLFLLARFATGLLEGNVSAVRAMLADRLEGNLRNRALSWLNGALHLGWLVGPLLAGLLVGLGVTVPFYVAAGALCLGAVLAAVSLEHEHKPAGHGSWLSVARESHAFNLLRHYELRMLFVVQFAYSCGSTAFFLFYPLWLVEVGGYGVREISHVNVLMCALLTLTAAFAGGPSRVEPLRRASVCALGVAVAIAAVGVGNLWIGIAGIVLFGLPHAFFNATILGWAAERFGSYGQGAVMGLLATTYCLANILMALAGAVLTLFDTRLVLVAGAAFSTWAAMRMRAWHGVQTRTA
ncbi:MFS transporter [Massilia horti]|uniref:MFS transporter n=1 Tax=Massilia horti TaxID=2562153 RepID=A0A4Y9SWD4_9BURK|nr:MFS transporter [Massilia horti]TFW28953.1 MFS transporter [Massilia horti]